MSGYGVAPPTARLCDHCGYLHVGTCPRIKSIEYHDNGTIKRIEFHPVNWMPIGGLQQGKEGKE